MKLEEYEREGRALYEAFAGTVSSIIAEAIEDAGGFKLQHVESRAKSVASLRQKLATRNLAPDCDITELKDLAGCRAIFYTNTDVERFLNSGIAEANFEVIERKLHHPTRQANEAVGLYTANHYVIRLTAERVALPEYRKFRGLKCELQIQTILNHSWAATAHDTIYKAPELERFGTEALSGIEKRLAKIAKKYLVPAGYEFDRVFHDFDRILQGKALLDEDALEAIVQADDNNERLAALETFGENVLPLYDDVQGVFPEVLSKIVDAARVAKKTEPAARETPFGGLPPTTFAEILQKIGEVLRPYRYVDIELLLSALRQIWELADTEDERKPLLSLAEGLAQHDLAIWKKHGPVAQDVIVSAIAGLSSEQRLAIVPLLARLLSSVLGSEVEGTTSSSSTVTLHFGAIRASRLLEAVRKRALDILDHLSAQELPREHMRDVRHALLQATEPPMRGSFERDLRLIIMSDTIRVLTTLTRQVGALAFDERQALEASVYRVFRMHAVLPSELRDDEALIHAQGEVLEAVVAFRDAANADSEFELYKVLVGFESVYPGAWKRTEFDWRADESYREERVKELLDSVTAKNSDTWFERLSKFATTESNDAATFPVMGKFVNDLAERHPETVLDWTKRDGPLVDKFLPGMLSGLMRSERSNDTTELITGWVEAGVRLGDISWFMRFADPFDEGLCRRTLKRAIDKAEIAPVRNCIDAAVRQYEKNPGELIESIFLPAVEAMARMNDTSWVRGWTPWLNAPLLKALNEKQAGIVLDALVPYERLEYDAEYIAAAIADRWPQRVLSFFTDRQEFKRKPDAPRYYDAIPFQVHQLRESLARVPALVLTNAMAWHQKWPEYFQYDGGKLIASIFPGLSPGLEDQLYPLVYKNPKFVLAVLGSYEGGSAIYPLVQAVIRQAEDDTELLRLAHNALDESGVVSGEFGYADLHAQRRELLRPWLDDESAFVQDFAKEHISYLDRRLAAETARAQASIASRKLAFNEDLAEDEHVIVDDLATDDIQDQAMLNEAS
jgi:ppGpp synthetase/RelA/SpoT-type nucleotidyltranferase